MTKQEAIEQVQAGRPVSEIAQAAGVTRATVYAWLKQAGWVAEVRPKQNETALVVNMPQAVKTMLEEISFRRGCSQSEVIRLLILAEHARAEK